MKNKMEIHKVLIMIVVALESELSLSGLVHAFLSGGAVQPVFEAPHSVSTYDQVKICSRFYRNFEATIEVRMDLVNGVDA